MPLELLLRHPMTPAIQQQGFMSLVSFKARSQTPVSPVHYLQTQLTDPIIKVLCVHLALKDAIPLVLENLPV